MLAFEAKVGFLSTQCISNGTFEKEQYKINSGKIRVISARSWLKVIFLNKSLKIQCMPFPKHHYSKFQSIQTVIKRVTGSQAKIIHQKSENEDKIFSKFLWVAPPPHKISSKSNNYFYFFFGFENSEKLHPLIWFQSLQNFVFGTFGALPDEYSCFCVSG